MTPKPLTVFVDAYGCDLREALHLAARQGYGAIQLSASSLGPDPRAFSNSARRHLRKYLSDLGLRLDACAADYPGLGLADPDAGEQRQEHFRRVLELNHDLQAARGATSLGGLADERHADRAREVLRMVADLTDRVGLRTALVDPQATPTALADELRAVGCPTLRLGLDTARLAGGVDVARQVAGLLDTLYLRDVRRVGDRVEEVAYGSGEVDFAEILALPDVGEADAALVVRRHPGAGVDALRQGREYIESLCGRRPSR